MPFIPEESGESVVVLFAIGGRADYCSLARQDGWGFALRRAAKVADPSSGFLLGDFFLVRLEIRPSHRENEQWKASITRKTAVCKVQPT